MPTSDATRLAVLIDSDNTTASVTTELLEEIAKYGTPTIKRAYGDWTTQQLAGWKEELLRHAIQPVQQFAYTRGKNATDSALIIDAMDLLYAENVEGFVIVSSDSDFTRLATRLRESGMTVYGLGRRSTPDAFVAACDRFIYLDLLSQRREARARGAGRPRAPTIAAKARAAPEDGNQQHVQRRRLVPSGRGRLLPGQEPRRVRSPRLRPHQARRTRPRAVLPGGQGHPRAGRDEPAVGAAQAGGSQSPHGAGAQRDRRRGQPGPAPSGAAHR